MDSGWVSRGALSLTSLLHHLPNRARRMFNEIVYARACAPVMIHIDTSSGRGELVGGVKQRRQPRL